MSNFEVDKATFSNVSAVIAVGVDETFSWWMDLLCLDKGVRLLSRQPIYFACSYDSPDEDETRSNVIEVVVERRLPTEADLTGCKYGSVDPGREYCIVTIQGSGMVVDLISSNYDLIPFDLAARYPYLV